MRVGGAALGMQRDGNVSWWLPFIWLFLKSSWTEKHDLNGHRKLARLPQGDVTKLDEPDQDAKFCQAYGKTKDVSRRKENWVESGESSQQPIQKCSWDLYITKNFRYLKWREPPEPYYRGMGFPIHKPYPYSFFWANGVQQNPLQPRCSR